MSAGALIRRRESRGVSRPINLFAAHSVRASLLLVISSPPQVAPSRRNTSTDDVNIALVLSYQRDLQIGGPVFRLVKRAAVNILTPIEQHVVVDVDQVVVDISVFVEQSSYVN